MEIRRRGTPRRSWETLDVKERADIIALWKTGIAFGKIGDFMRIPASTVHNFLQASGFTRSRAEQLVTYKAHYGERNIYVEYRRNQTSLRELLKLADGSQEVRGQRKKTDHHSGS